jgi:hypothetical protein
VIWFVTISAVVRSMRSRPSTSASCSSTPRPRPYLSITARDEVQHDHAKTAAEIWKRIDITREPTQSAADYQGAVGSAPPPSLAQKSLPDDVTDQVPETKSYLFIKLPDRILLIDPDTKTVAEIVGGPLTTGASPSDQSNAGMPQR